LDWPCPSGPVTGAEETQLNAMIADAENAEIRHARNTHAPPTPIKNAQVRVLAFGPLPNGTPGTMFAAAMYWQKNGTTPAQIIDSYADADGIASSGRLGPIPVAGDPPLLATPSNMAPPTPTTSNWCNDLAANPPTPPMETTVTCTNTVVARAGVTAVRLVRGPDEADPPTPVHNGLAGVYEAPHWTSDVKTHWRIEALNSHGQVIGSIPYTAMF
jgi:hypothetical protein